MSEPLASVVVVVVVEVVVVAVVPAVVASRQILPRREVPMASCSSPHALTHTSPFKNWKLVHS